MGIRQRIGEKRAHAHRMGSGAAEFLKGKYTFAEGEIIKFRVDGYKNQFHLRSKTSDVPTFYQCIFDKEYDIAFKNDPKVIVDLGANIGLTTVFFKSKYPEAKIIAVEPESSNFEMLKKNIDGLSNIFPVKSAIWNKSTHLEVEDTGKGHYGYTVKPVDGPTDKSFLALGIAELMKEHNIETIDVLKIDIEGAEKELFEENFDFWIKRTRCLIVELHDRFKPNSAKTVLKAMTQYDFTFSMKGENIIFYLD